MLFVVFSNLQNSETPSSESKKRFAIASDLFAPTALTSSERRRREQIRVSFWFCAVVLPYGVPPSMKCRRPGGCAVRIIAAGTAALHIAYPIAGTAVYFRAFYRHTKIFKRLNPKRHKLFILALSWGVQNDRLFPFWEIIISPDRKALNHAD